ncbi:MAG TPA: hypothetical protein EYP10_03570, partial [Armatimonadetes bacterium]|nr:hypothetical protein [Armatimonadota bacterium]
MEEFRFALLRITYLPLSTLQFSGYPGVVLRGALGTALKQVACFDKVACAKGCAHPHQCAYGQLFETPVPPDSPIFAEQTSAVRPFVIEPPISDEWRVTDDETLRINHHTLHPTYAPGDQLIFHLILIGKALDYLPYFVYALMRMGERGIRNVRCVLERIE